MNGPLSIVWNDAPDDGTHFDESGVPRKSGARAATLVEK